MERTDKEAQESAMQSLDRELDEKSVWPVERLVDHLKKDHRRFLETVLPGIEELSRAIERRPLTRFIESMTSELVGHFRTEESIVFPVLISMQNQNPGALSAALQYACRHMKHDHAMHERHLKTLAAFQNELEPDRDNGNILPLINMLDDFTRHMYLHMSIENRFLFAPYLDDARLNRE